MIDDPRISNCSESRQETNAGLTIDGEKNCISTCIWRAKSNVTAHYENTKGLTRMNLSEQ